MLTGQSVIPSTRYIWPPRAQAAVPRGEAGVYAMYGWEAQLKYNDSHALFKFLPGWESEDRSIEIWNRHGEKLRNWTLPDHIRHELRELAHKLSITDWTLLDGGIIDSKHTAIKDTIVLWDILVLNSQSLTGTTYQERYNHLTDSLAGNNNWYYEHKSHDPVDFGHALTPNIILPKNYKSEHWPKIWAIIDIINQPYTDGLTGEVRPLIEGLVFKDPTGILKSGFRENNNSDWLGRSRVRTLRHRF